MMRHVIEPALTECGYEAKRAHEIDEPGNITQQIIERLIEAPLVVADLTDYNPNVFYELSVRHAARKPLVQLIQQGQPIPFDVSPTRTIQVDFPDPDAIVESRKRLVAQIRAVENDPSLVDNPISSAIDLMQMKASGKPVEVQTAQILEAIASLQSEVREIKRSVSAASSVIRYSVAPATGGLSVFGTPSVVLSAGVPPPDAIAVKAPNVKSAESDHRK
jgi:hypothetical protein